MAKVDILDVLRAKQYDPLEFHFDNLTIPNMYCYLSQQDIDALRMIATSAKFASKIDKKYEEIDKIMRNRGFKRFSAGTNRVVYRHLEDTRFLAKIAVDKVGMQDNPLEYKNQFLLKPFVTKMFQISPCGTVGFSERVLPIKHKAEFREVASDVFDILINKILGTYVVEDVGTKYFMNWGIRYGFGPVLLDYPYVYELDGNKLFCTAIDQQTGCMCNGEIDYDAGFNKLVCTKCGKKYLATDLRDDTPYNKIIVKGGNEMKVRIKNGDKTVFESDGMDEFIKKPNKAKPDGRDLKVRVLRNGIPIERPAEESVTEETTEVEVVDDVIETPIEENIESTVVDMVDTDREEEVNNDPEEILIETEVIGQKDFDPIDSLPEKPSSTNEGLDSKLNDETELPTEHNAENAVKVNSGLSEESIVYRSGDNNNNTSMANAFHAATFIRKDKGGKKNKKKGNKAVVVVHKNDK